jgi:hypothetical protein
MTAQRTSIGRSGSARRLGVWLLAVVVGLAGCAHSPARSVARVWEEVPKIPWTRVSDDLPEGKARESKVAANKPSDVSSEEKSSGTDRASSRFRLPSRHADEKGKTSTDSRSVASKSSSKPKGERNVGPVDPFLEDEPSAVRVVSKKKPSPAVDDAAAEPSVVSARDRLRAALSDDSRREEPPADRAGAHEQLRLRIESLMARAKDHLEESQLVAAKRAAELAQDLVEASNLEFLPDEERPVDLLTMINGRIEAENAQREIAENDAGADADLRESPAAEDQQAKTAARRRVVRHPFDRAVPFDPYAPRVALARHHESQDQLFGTAMIVLESPSFEDEPSVNPIAYTRHADRTATEELIEVETLPLRKSTIPSLPEEEDDSRDEIALPQLPVDDEDDQEIAPAPPVFESARQRRDWSGIPEPALKHDYDDDSEEASESEVRRASVWPRWIPLSMLSLLTSGFCIWLWRRRQNANG